jgi:hypothetical protein
LAEHGRTPSDESLNQVTDAISQCYSAFKAHKQELDAVWSQTTSKDKDELVYVFLDLLVRKYPTEHSELRQYVRCQEEAQLVELLETYKEVYLIGYMLGKDWIPKSSATVVLLSHGEQVREYIQSALEEAQSQAMAFTEGLSEVVEKGTQFALSGRE